MKKSYNNYKEQSLQTEIDSATLRDWLEKGKPVKVIDIRPASDFAEWHIAGAENVDAYDALYARQPGPLQDFDPPPDTPIVAVCFVGQTSKMAANYLRSRGQNAMSLTGGMQSWSTAWNSAQIPLDKSKAHLIQVRRTGKGCLSYIVASEGEATIIDPSVDPQVYLDVAARHDWEITNVIDSHVHADHLTRGRVLAEQTGSRYHLPAQDRVSFDFQPLKDGDTIHIGKTKLKALHTPGHTFESMSFLLDDEVLFTGDTLFLTSIGRPDLKASFKETEQRTHMLYKSLMQLSSLPEETLVLPTHTNAPVPFDEIPIYSTLGEVKEKIEVLKFEEDEFVAFLLNHIPETPPNHMQIVHLNEAGSFPDGDITLLEAGANRCAI